MKIKVFYNTEPIIDEKIDDVTGKKYGLHRERYNGKVWGEIRWSLMDDRVTEVDLTQDLRKTLVEDICFALPDYKVYNKLIEFNLIKDGN